MKNLATVLVISILVLTVASSAMADPYVSGRGGAYFPDKGGFDTGYNFGFSYGVSLGDIMTESVKYNPGLSRITTEFGIGVYNAERDLPYGDVDLTVVPLTASVIYNLPIHNSPFDLYAGGGPGFYIATVDAPGDDDTDLEFGVHLVAGAAFNVDTQLAFFTELRGDLVTDDVGGGFLNFGVKYKF